MKCFGWGYHQVSTATNNCQNCITDTMTTTQTTSSHNTYIQYFIVASQSRQKASKSITYLPCNIRHCSKWWRYMSNHDMYLCTLRHSEVEERSPHTSCQYWQIAWTHTQTHTRTASEGKILGHHHKYHTLCTSYSYCTDHWYWPNLYHKQPVTPHCLLLHGLHILCPMSQLLPPQQPTCHGQMATYRHNGYLGVSEYGSARSRLWSNWVSLQHHVWHSVRVRAKVILTVECTYQLTAPPSSSSIVTVCLMLSSLPHWVIHVSIHEKITTWNIPNS